MSKHKKSKHIHKYQRAMLGDKHVIYRCVLMDCSHYVDARLIEGRLSVCHRCDEPFQIGKKAALLAKPHCDECTRNMKSSVNKVQHLTVEQPQQLTKEEKAVVRQTNRTIDRLKELLNSTDLLKEI